MVLTIAHCNEAYLASELSPSFHIRKGGKNLGNRWTKALSAAPTGVQASITPKMKAERDQRSETLCSVRNVKHKITEDTLNIPQIFVTIYVPQQTNLLGKFNGSPLHTPRNNRHKSNR